MLRLRTFGGLSIERIGGAAPSAGATSARRRLALLAVLAANAPHGFARDKLLALFWPENDTDRARHALDQTLYQLKRDLGGEGVLLGREELSLDPAGITSDVGEFRAALARGDRAAAVELYTGPFLDGVYVPGAAELERWADEERAALAHEYERALETLATEAAARGDRAAAIQWWQRLAALDPRKTRVIVALMSELAAGGDRTAALRHAEMYRTLVGDDPDVEPNPAVAALADQLKRQPPPAPPSVSPRSVSPAAAPVASSGSPRTPLSPTSAPSSAGATQSVPSPSDAPIGPDRAAFASRYIIDREIGRGGSATVFLAQDTHNGRPVALKVLRPELAAGIAVDRFRDEITVTANLQHPHILPIHDSGEADGKLFIVMPFVEGESLRHRLEREGRLPVADALRLAREMGSALSYAHARGIVHRDIKPENILLASGHAIVADFGLARALGSATTQRYHTSPGTVVGTLAYLSPEQVTGGKADARSDQYSLAYLLYEMLAGEPPFKGPGMHELMAQRIAGTPPSIRGRRPDVPQSVDEALLRALSPDPERRFDDVAMFARAMDLPALVSGESSSATPGARPADLPPDAAATASPGDGHRSVPHPGGTLRWVRDRVARGQRVAGVAIVLVLLVALSIAWTLRNRPPIDQREWILLANFENATSDSIFDRALNAALFAGLQQSDYVSVVSRARVQQTLARMGRSPAEAASQRLDETLAREVARREGVRAVVAGSIHDVDGSYLITARVVDATTGDALVSEQVTVASRAEVIAGVGEVVQRLRRAIGESATAIARRDMPLPYATTPSLDALRKYADGIRAHDAGQLAAAMELWQEALALDSNFALVHVELGRAYYWSNNRPRGDAHFARALSLLDRLTPRERLQIQATIESSRENRERAITLRRAMLAEYPNDPTAWGHIGYDYLRLERPAEAIEALKNQLARDSSNANQYINLAVAYKGTGQVDEAVRSYERAFALQPTYRTVNNINHEYGQLLVLAGRVAEARAVHDSMLRGSADQRAHGERSLGLIDMYEGRYAAAIERFRQATLLSIRPNRELTQARNRLFLASVQQEKGGAWQDSARAELRAAHALFRQAYFEPTFLMYLGKSLVRDEQLPLATEVLDTLLKRAQPANPQDGVNVQVLAGEIALARGLADSAVRLLRRAQTIDSSAYVTESLARALGLAGDLAGSAKLYERLATSEDYYGWEGQVFGLLAPRDLGRVYERMGDTARAIAAYERLTSRWAAADSDILALREARGRLSELRLGTDRPRTVPR